MIKILYCNKKNYKSELNKLLLKRQRNIKINGKIVKKIIQEIKLNGDSAIVKYEKKYNKNTEIKINKNKILKNIKTLDPKIKKAIDFSYNRIKKFHELQKTKDIKYIDKYM